MMSIAPCLLVLLTVIVLPTVQQNVTAEFVQLQDFLNSHWKPANIDNNTMLNVSMVLYCHPIFFSADTNKLDVFLRLEFTYADPRLQSWQIENHPSKQKVISLNEGGENVMVESFLEWYTANPDAKPIMQLNNNQTVSVLYAWRQRMLCDEVNSNNYCYLSLPFLSTQPMNVNSVQMSVNFTRLSWQYWQLVNNWSHVESGMEASKQLTVLVRMSPSSEDPNRHVMLTVAAMTGVFVVGQFLLLARASARILFHLVHLSAQFHWLLTMEEFPMFQNTNSLPREFVLFACLIGLQCVALIWSVLLQWKRENFAVEVPTCLQAMYIWTYRCIACQSAESFSNDSLLREHMHHTALLAGNDSLGAVYWAVSADNDLAAAPPNTEAVGDEEEGNLYESLARGHISTVISESATGASSSSSVAGQVFISFGMIRTFLDRCMAVLLGVVVMIIFLAI